MKKEIVFQKERIKNKIYEKAKIILKRGREIDRQEIMRNL